MGTHREEVGSSFEHAKPAVGGRRVFSPSVLSRTLRRARLARRFLFHQIQADYEGFPVPPSLGPPYRFR
jgi:hypothetical protein